MNNNDWYITSAMLTRERVAYAALAVSLLLTIFGIATSPSEVPIHWGFGAEPDAYGSPWMWLLVWFLLTATVVVCAFITKHVKVTNWNKPYPMEGKLLDAWFSFSMAIMFDTMLMLSVLELAFAAIVAARLYSAMPILLLALAVAVISYAVYSIAKWRSVKRKL